MHKFLNNEYKYLGKSKFKDGYLIYFDAKIDDFPILPFKFLARTDFNLKNGGLFNAETKISIEGKKNSASGEVCENLSIIFINSDELVSDEIGSVVIRKIIRQDLGSGPINLH